MCKYFSQKDSTKGFISPSSQVHTHMNALYLPCKYWLQWTMVKGSNSLKNESFWRLPKPTLIIFQLSGHTQPNPTLPYPTLITFMIWSLEVSEGKELCLQKSGHLEFMWATQDSTWQKNLSPSTSLTPLLTISFKC